MTLYCQLTPVTNMALTDSNPIPLHSVAPEFQLKNVVTDQWISLPKQNEFKATVIMFICNHCPYVIHVNPELIRLANDYIPKGVHFIAISSNDVTHYPDDSPELMLVQAKQLNYPFPYCYDESQEVARAYDAACTPDFYVFNAELKLAYHGRLDASRPGNDLPINGLDIRNALDALLINEAPAEIQYPSMGCNIKWKK